MDTYRERRLRLGRHLDSQDIDLFLVADTEEHRSPALRYLTGHPMDALLFLDRRGRSILLPWDLPLAERRAQADRILPYNDFGRRPLPALLGILKKEGYSPAETLRLALDKRLSYPTVQTIKEELQVPFPNLEISCSHGGPDAFIEEMRLVKDPGERDKIRRAAEILNQIIAGIEAALKKGELKSEADAALYIEKECRRLGAEGTGFDTIAAGPERSFGIHAFPPYGAGIFADPKRPGLSILDFGAVYQGYAGDVTLTVCSGSLSPRQRLLVELVEEAYAAALELCLPGAPVSRITAAVDQIFARHELSMPHALGHGLGLQVHEAPFLRSPSDQEILLQPGMVFTLEPGLYDPQAGGVRLENDILITPTGRELLTSSRILYI